MPQMIPLMVLALLCMQCLAVTPENATSAPSTNAPDESPDRTLMIVHGWIMSVAFVICVPIGVFSKRFGAIVFGLDPIVAFRAHVVLMSTGGVLAIIGFAIAVNRFEADKGTGYAKHTTLGYVLFSLCLGQLALGVTSAFCKAEGDKGRKSFHYVHLVLGMIVLLFGGFQCSSGIKTLRQQGHPDAAYAIQIYGIVIHAIIIVTVICCLVIRRRKNQAIKAAAAEGKVNGGGRDATPVVTSPSEGSGV